MSTEAKQPVVECHGPDCNIAGQRWTFHHGKFCSNECEARREGQKALSGPKYRHTRCFTCLSELKHIEKPKPDYAFDESDAEFTYNSEKEIVEMVWYSQEETRRAACGFQHLTPNAEIGEKNVGPKIVTGTVCGECGVADHTQHVTMLADDERTVRFVRKHLAEDDDNEFDPDVLERRYAETGDIEVAAGAAIIVCRG